jgi:hypothetical protein
MDAAMVVIPPKNAMTDVLPRTSRKSEVEALYGVFERSFMVSVAPSQSRFTAIKCMSLTEFAGFPESIVFFPGVRSHARKKKN